jgi:hypothetical protein
VGPGPLETLKTKGAREVKGGSDGAKDSVFADALCGGDGFAGLFSCHAFFRSDYIESVPQGRQRDPTSYRRFSHGVDEART